MQNLDQIRAKNALSAATGNTYKGANDGNVVKKIPTMIMNNGILATAAFALDNKGAGYSGVFEAVIQHLNDKNIKCLPSDKNIRTTEQLIDFLSSTNSCALRNVTAEAMAYLNYLRRFAKNNNKEK
jgi:CRISPR type III-B/RAMP module-associated protein Cmr5